MSDMRLRQMIADALKCRPAEIEILDFDESITADKEFSFTIWYKRKRYEVRFVRKQLQYVMDESGATLYRNPKGRAL